MDGIDSTELGFLKQFLSGSILRTTAASILIVSYAAVREAYSGVARIEYRVLK